VISVRRLAFAVLVVGVVLDVLGDRPSPVVPPERGGYFVLAIDFHVHSFLGDGALAPWLLVGEARRRGLDALAITNHNRTWPARLARWLARDPGGPIVLVGEEVTARGFHITGVGVEDPVDWTHSASDAIDAIHAQGGIAIAAHPGLKFWPAFDEAALRKLDGVERAHADIYQRRSTDRLFAIFLASARAYQPTMAAIGASDFHVVGYPGFGRTYVFAREPSARGILDAVRAGRTVVYDRHGQPRGDPALFPLLPPDNRAVLDVGPRPGVGSFCAWLGLLGLLLLGRRGWRRERGSAVGGR
jgi:predicted metal-dependent phosphoesterase TrpH